MKTLSVILKNLKVLFRSKGSAMVVLLAPLLIVLVIGFGFAESGESTLNIGIHVDEHSDLANRFINNLNTTENNIILFKNESRCINSIKEGVSVACINFPKNFKIEDNASNEVTFHIDESRINLAYRLISSLQLNLDVESEAVSQELTSKLLEIITSASKDVDASIASIISLKASTMKTKSTSSSSTSTLSGLDAETVDVDLSTIASELSSLSTDFSSLRNKAKDAVSSGYKLLDNASISAPELKSDLSSLNVSITATATSVTSIAQLSTDINKAKTNVDNMKSKLANAKNVKSSVLDNLGKLSSDLDKISSDLDTVKVKQERIKANIASFNLRNAESIVNPITTKIEPVTAKNTRLTYSFPYLLMLIVLFVGIMLSGTLVFMEKDSKAFFRTFTTPAKNVFFVWTTYLTSAMTIIVQVLLILLVVKYWLEVPVFTNIFASILIIFLSLTVFIFGGIFLGNLFNTSQAITMGTISIGSILLFLSNLVLPIETLSPAIQNLIKYNPYVLASEALRRAILFQTPIKGMIFEITVLTIYSILLLAGIIIVIKIYSSKYLSSIHITGKRNIIRNPEDHYLHIKELNLTIKDIQGLVDIIKSMSDKEYENTVRPKNVFADWLKNSYKDRILSILVRRKSRLKVIEILERHIRKTNS